MSYLYVINTLTSNPLPFNLRKTLSTDDDIDFISEGEKIMQSFYKYRIDDVLYSELKFNKNNNMKMKINITEQTTTFPYPVNKLKGHLIDNLGMEWNTEFGEVLLTQRSVNWIMKDVKTSMYNDNRSYIYNKAFARWFDNNDAYELDNAKQMNQVEQKRNGTLTGGLAPTGIRQQKYCGESCSEVSMFELIRAWADKRGLYDKGDPKTQALKLVEEVGETCRAILKGNDMEAIDGIGDCVVVLTNLAELLGESIEGCIEQAYFEIKDRTGKMENGTFKKD